MKRLCKYLKGSIPFVVLAPLFMLLEVMMDLMQPTMMADIIDVGVANGDMAYVLSSGIKMLGIAFAGFIGGAGCCVFSAIAGVSFGTRLRQGIFDKVQTFSFREIDRLKTSSLVTRLTNDVNQVQMMVMMLLKGLIRAPFSCIGGLVMALSFNGKLSLIFLAAMPVLAVVVVFIVRRSFPLFTRMQEKIDRVNTVMRENLLGVRVVKAFVTQDRERQRFESANEDLMNWSIKAQRITILLWPWVTLVTNLCIVALLWFGGNMAIAGEIETGKIMAFMNYLVQILGSLMMSVMIVINFARATASARRINEVLDTQPSIQDPAQPQLPEHFDVRFENVSFRYNDDVADEEPVLKNISFTAQEGERIGIIGSTGSGKSSLVGLIPRLYDVTGGAIRIGGVDVRDIAQDDLRRMIGVVMQESLLFSGTIEENLRWGGQDTSPEALRQAVQDAQAEEFVYQLPKQLLSPVEQRGKNFSGGQKQRLSIARTFVKHPKILILDDSTSAVDMATEAKIQESLRQSHSGSTTFIIAQRISAISDCDKILVLDDGVLTACATHSQLLKTSEIYRSIAVSQLGEEVLDHVRT